MVKKKLTRLELDVWKLASNKSTEEEKSIEDIINSILRKELTKEGGDLVE